MPTQLALLSISCLFCHLKAEAIGFDCGFDSPFYKCFKKHYGISPARYRVACLASKEAEAERDVAKM